MSHSKVPNPIRRFLLRISDGWILSRCSTNRSKRFIVWHSPDVNSLSAFGAVSIAQYLFLLVSALFTAQKRNNFAARCFFMFSHFSDSQQLNCGWVCQVQLRLPSFSRALLASGNEWDWGGRAQAKCRDTYKVTQDPTIRVSTQLSNPAQWSLACARQANHDHKWIDTF